MRRLDDLHAAVEIDMEIRGPAGRAREREHAGRGGADEAGDASNAAFVVLGGKGQIEAIYAVAYAAPHKIPPRQSGEQAPQRRFR